MSPINPLHNFVRRMASELECDIDRLADLVRSDDSDGKLRMLAFAGYRNDAELRVRGRMVRFVEPLEPGAGTWSKIRAMLAIYNSQEVAGVLVRCDTAGKSIEVSTDEEGYFDFSLPISMPLPASTLWEAVTLSTPGHIMQSPSVEVPILAPGSDDHWGIISDIDDTVIETGATNFLKNWRRVLVERPEDRLAVPGAAGLYRTIARDHVTPTRPFFYISSSPWNLYGFLTEFMELNRIPHGPMFLKDLGIDETKLFGTGHENHKLSAIKTVLEFYPEHKFLLMGDNGQRDVEIYAEAVRTYPNRVGAVFIRDVSASCGSGEKAELLSAMAAEGVRTYCAPDFAGGVAILEALGIERPVEAAQASGQASES